MIVLKPIHNEIELYSDSSCLLPLFWCPCMAINIRVQYNGGLLLDIILLALSYYHRGRNPIKCHEEVLSLQPMFPPNTRFDHFPPCLENAQKVI